MISLSRSKVALYMDCPACFYKEVKLKIKRPDSLPFTLNNAVDSLLKKEFDYYRDLQIPHPNIIDSGMNYIPAKIADLEDWRNSKKGIRYKSDALNLELFGAIDDIWINSDGQLVVVDYKATARQTMVTELNNGYHIHFKRQMEFYQWLLIQKGFQVDQVGFFVYCTGRTGEAALNGVLKFDINLIPYTGSWEWIEVILYEIKMVLDSDCIPASMNGCKYCTYVEDSMRFI